MEALRQSRSNRITASIEDRLRKYTDRVYNSEPKAIAENNPEVVFRNHVEETVDSINRLSINKLKNKISIRKTYVPLTYPLAQNHSL